jgi:hypothetical protein
MAGAMPFAVRGAVDANTSFGEAMSNQSGLLSPRLGMSITGLLPLLSISAAGWGITVLEVGWNVKRLPWTHCEKAELVLCKYVFIQCYE